MTERQDGPSCEFCPACGADSRVVDSRPRRTHRYRRRRCLSQLCRYEWETYESFVNPDDLPPKLVRNLGA